MSLDASLRRSQLIAEARGYIVPDSNAVLDDSPQVIIEPGDEDIQLIFNDGLGIGAAKNVYQGYSWNFIWHNLGTINQVVTDGTAPNPSDVLVYDDETGTYVPSAEPNTDVMGIVIEVPVDKTYTLINSMPYDLTIVGLSGFTETGPSLTISITNTGGVVASGDPLELVVSGTDDTSTFLTVDLNYSRSFLA